MRRGLWLVVPLAFALALAKAPPKAPPVYDPDPAQPGAGALKGETWSKESPAASLWLTRIDEPTRIEFIKRRAGLTTDPFAPAAGREGAAFLAFHILVENRTDARLVFEPQSCRLQTGWKDFQTPLDLPTIVSLYAMADRPAPDGIEKIRAAILDGQVVLLPGEKRDGLFLFHTFDPAVKTFQIDVEATLSDGKPFGFSAFYKRRPK